MSYTKLFNTLLTSTIWNEDNETRIVWITMLVMADRNGEVLGTIPGLAHMARVSPEACRRALTKFMSADLYSRTQDAEGRRIEEIDGGWVLLNHAKYREMASKEQSRTANVERQRRYREKTAGLAGPNRLCAYCGEKATGADHVIPKTKGGGDGPHNTVAACGRCNVYKGARDLVDFLNDFTLPFKIDRERVLSHPLLAKIVTTCNGSFVAVTQGRDIAEADTEADTEAKNKISGANAPSSSGDDRQRPFNLALPTRKSIIEEAVDCWNEFAVKSNWPKVNNGKLSTARRTSLKARMEEIGGIEGWRIAVARAAKSDFLCGRTGRGDGHENWRFDFDDMIKAKFFTRIMEGKYDGSGAKPKVDGAHEGIQQAMTPRTYEQQMEYFFNGQRDHDGEGATIIEGTYETSAG